MSKQPVPRALKPITAFIRRAEEHDTKEGDAHRVVAYYCREYAAELGFKLVQRNGSSSPEVDSYLGGVIDKLLAEKEEIKALATREEAKSICTEFANNLFMTADEEDRAGLADKETAMRFYMAGNIFDVLAQFGDLEPEILEKKKYAKYKATDILAALKEGRAPTPGAPGEEVSTGMPPDAVAGSSASAPASDDLDIPHAPNDSLNTLVPAPAMVEAPSPAPAPAPYVPAPAPYAPAPASAPNVSAAAAPSAAGRSAPAAIADAIELSKFAISALEHKQTALAVERLEQALKCLRGR